MNPFKNLKQSWPAIKIWLVKTVLKRYFPKLLGGSWGWLVAFLAEKLIDKTLKKPWNFIVRKISSAWGKISRKPRAERLEKAKNENDFDDSFDDMP